MEILANILAALRTEQNGWQFAEDIFDEFLERKYLHFDWNVTEGCS